MINNWVYKKISDVMLVERGGSPRPIQKYLTDSEDGINWIKISDATASDKYIFETKQKITKEGLHKTRLVNEGDFILSNSMSFGRPYIMKTTGCIHDGWLVLKQKEENILDKDFLYHLLGSPYIFQQFDNLAAGSTVRNLNIGLVSSVKIPIPPLQEQQQIVAILDQGFEAIDQAKANIEKNIANAKELFQSKLNAIFSQKGDGWEEDKLKNITTKIGSGATPRGGQAAYKESGISLIRSMNVHDAGFTSKKLAFIDDEQASKLNNVIIEENDVLLNITGASVARCCLAIKEFIPARVNQHVSIIRPIKDKIDSNYLHFLLTSKKNKDLLLGIGEQGSTRQAITKVQIENFVVSYPKSIEEQKSLIAEVTTIKSKSKKIKKIYKDKLSNLEDLKKSILQKAFAGELTNKEESVHLKQVAEPEARYSKK
jgi:type I restriction enzyme S subunit